METNGAGASLRAWQLRIFGLLWGAYASYYLCRVNFAVAQPAILQEFPNWTGADIGSIPSVYAVTYALGQMVNGILGQRFGARRMMTLALLVAAVTNLLFARADSLSEMRVLWAINGWGQSAGWALMVQTMSDWQTAGRRGIWISRLSTSYQLGHVASWLLAGALCDGVGWRAAFLVPGLVLPLVALAFLLFLRDTPEQAGFLPIRDDVAGYLRGEQRDSAGSAGAMGPVLKRTLSSGILWILALAFFAMNAVRYGFINWSVHYMAEFHGRTISDSVATSIVIPLAGAAGALSAGWASDVLFGRRRAPVCVIMLLGGALTCVGIALMPRGEWLGTTVLLAVAGFMVYGPDVLIAGAATVDFSHPKAAAIATGFTMFLGALGAIFSGAGIGYFKDLGRGDWSLIFGLLAALSLLPALLVAPLWNIRPRQGGPA